MRDPLTGPIKILPEQLINKIAAGEVVERPASIIKELVENAIDAGADQISVTIKNGGKNQITILDNGSGMDEDNARLAIERHATSKIYEEKDLDQIDTLGFRGEALASIASVSHFELLTCHDENQGGTRLLIKGGALEALSKTGFPRGTKITVEQLFFNTPARLKFMKTSPTEFRHIQETILHQALAWPRIQFRLTHNQQLVFSLPRGDSLEQRIYQLFGDEFQDGLLPIEHEETYLQYEGFLSAPTHAKSTKRWQYLFVNDRFVKCPPVNHAVYDAYRTLLTKNQHPVFFLKLFLDPSEVDVNVHPAKTEIRFRNSHLIHTILADHLGKALMEASHRRHFGNQMQAAMPLTTPPPRDARPSAPPSNAFQPSVLPNPRRSILQEQMEIPIPSESFSGSITQSTSSRVSKQGNEKKIKKSKKSTPHLSEAKRPASLKAESDKKQNPITPIPEESVTNQAIEPLLHVLGQIQRRYILVEKKDRIMLFDQHAASEQGNYVLYYEEFQVGRIQTESFLVPLLMELSPQNAILLEQHLSFFEKLGFNIDSFGKTTYSIRGIPMILPKDVCQAAILSVLEELVLFGKSRRPDEIIQHILEKVACNAAIKSGEVLEMEVMQQLVFDLEKMNPLSFRPHGRPVSIEISKQELEKRFNRPI